jgi:hypothetical protein
VVVLVLVDMLKAFRPVLALLLVLVCHLEDKAFNHVSTTSKSFISNPAHDYLAKTYGYVAAGLASSAAGAMMAFRSGVAHRLLSVSCHGIFKFEF